MKVELADVPYQQAYHLLNGTVIPRPIAFVSTLSKAGEPNLAPFSFYNIVCARPAAISFAVMRRGEAGDKKDTVANIEETREFVVNAVIEEIADRVNATSVDVPRDVDEWQLGGFTPLKSDHVAPARVAESPIQLECRLLQIVELGDGPGGGSLIVGQVLTAHVDDAILTNGRIDPNLYHAVARMGGAAWCRTTDRFDLPRPVLAPAVTK